MRESYEKAGRLARTIVADFFLYNQDKVNRAIKEDNLFSVLGTEIEDSEKFYNENVPLKVRQNSNYFWDTFFNRLVTREAQILEQ
jgi:hypothetical protein